MQQVFLIQAHTDVEFLIRLITKLDSPNHYFAIHIDKKSEEMFQSLNSLKLRNNILIINDFKINWGGANQFFTTLRLMELSIEKWPNIEYFHLISGQDFPTKTNEDIDCFFKKNRDKNFMSVTTNPHLNYRYDIFYPRDILNIKNCSIPVRYMINAFIFIQQKLVDVGVRFRQRIPLNIFKGSNWWSLNRDAVDYILGFISNNPSFKSRFRYTNCCDEIFFHTILYNSCLKDTIVGDDLRYIDWTDNGRGFPNVLDETDYENIIHSDKFFCRKIISGKSDGLISLLEKNRVK